MEEKRYPILDEEENIDMACEPMASVAIDNGNVYDWTDDLDWDSLPSQGPFSEEEAIARVDQFEDNLKKGQVKWTSSEDFDRQLFEEFPWLR